MDKLVVQDGFKELNQFGLLVPSSVTISKVEPLIRILNPVVVKSVALYPEMETVEVQVARAGTPRLGPVLVAVRVWAKGAVPGASMAGMPENSGVPCPWLLVQLHWAVVQV